MHETLRYKLLKRRSRKIIIPQNQATGAWDLELLMLVQEALNYESMRPAATIADKKAQPQNKKWDEHSPPYYYLLKRTVSSKI